MISDPDYPLCEKLCNTRHEVINTRLHAMDSALELKTQQMEIRLHLLNELRADVIRDRELLVRKEAYDIKIENYDMFINDVAKRLAVVETRFPAMEARLDSLRETYEGKVKLYDSFVSAMSDRVTVIETRSITWTTALGLLFVVVQVVLHFVVK